MKPRTFLAAVLILAAIAIWLRNDPEILGIPNPLALQNKTVRFSSHHDTSIADESLP